MSYFGIKWVVSHTVRGLQTFGGMFSPTEIHKREFPNREQALDFYQRAKAPKKLLKLTIKEEVEVSND